MYLDHYDGYHVLSDTGGQTGQKREFKNLENVEVLHEISWYDGNRWKRDNEIVIFKFDGGFGLATLTPAGWSSWTYDPNETFTVMYTNDFKKFTDLALDSEQRNHLERVL